VTARVVHALPVIAPPDGWGDQCARKAAMTMRQAEIDEMRACLLTRRTKFYYFRDRYAIMLLSDAVGSGAHVRDLKQSRYAPLLRKPIVKQITSTLRDGLLTQAALQSAWPDRPEAYRLSLGQWGDARGRDTRWHQISRPGANLVLHLNFTNQHDAVYRKLNGDGDRHWFQWSCHPHDGDGLLTLAWARMDVDMEAGEALIEEIQTDWLRGLRWGLRHVENAPADAAVRAIRRMFKNDDVTVAQFRGYAEDLLRRHEGLWDEAMLSAAIWLLRCEIGISRIFYHTFESGNILKGLNEDRNRPPRSVYTALPRRFCFELTDQPPGLLRRCQNRKVRALLRTGNLRWFVVEL
jgi:hypothetical protein